MFGSKNGGFENKMSKETYNFKAQETNDNRIWNRMENRGKEEKEQN